ncbi:hypothetical protein [Arthrobacter sp. SD76]|jgi:hypothetical protein|uniref:hypothetical protein n=1 Tax=Arthrobacter sp. SD76 TaxID=3415007 RepID=UPI003C74A257
MNRISRLFVASCAGVALTFTASPALAAHTDDGAGAHVEHNEFVFDDGTTYEYRHVVRNHGGYYNTTNSRDQWDSPDESTQYSLDWKQHYVELGNVTKLGSQYTTTENGETCRTTTVFVEANGETRRVKDDLC